MSTKGRLRAAFAAFKKEDYAAAEREAEAHLTNDPLSYDAHLLLGKCAYRLEQTEKAERCYAGATSLRPTELPGWQGLLELFEHSDTQSEKAIAPLKQLIAILEASYQIEDAERERMLQYQLRLADLYRRLSQRSDAEEVLKDVLFGLDYESPSRLKCLCLLADLQLMDYEAEIQNRMLKECENLQCSLHNREECQYDALLNRVTGQYAEEALEADHDVGGTLTEITALAPPCGPYRKYYDFYLQIFCKAMYTTPASSTDRYNLRLQTLERCYKTIHGRSGKAQGLCTTPFPYVTALRLLEINEEIVGGSQRPALKPLPNQGVRSDIDQKLPSMFRKSESDPSLHRLATFSPSSGSHGTPRKVSPLAGKSIRIKLTGGVGPFGKGQRESPVARRLSLERRNSLDGKHSSYRLGVSSPDFIPTSPVAGATPPLDMPPVFEASELALPKFMRSNSLSCVRRLHRLDSGFLEQPKQIIGGNSSPLVTEVSEAVGRKLARVLPWHPESKIQLVLAIRRKEKFPEEKATDRIDETPVTDFEELPSNVLAVSERVKAHIRVLESGIASGSLLTVARMALVDLLLQEKVYVRALECCDEAIRCIETQAKEGGYPRTQACLTFRLQKAAALFRLRRFGEAEEQYRLLAEGVSEGTVSYGALAGCEHVSVRQAAMKGLFNIAQAQGNRSRALRLYEQMMGAGLMGKSPIEHWAAAEYGYMLYEDGDTVRAKQYLEKALEILKRLPRPEDRIEADYHFKLAQVYWVLGGKWRTAPQYAYDHLVVASSVEGPHQAGAYAWLGKHATEVDGDAEKAKTYYEKALQLDPEQDAMGYAYWSLLKDVHSSVKGQMLRKYRGCRAVWVEDCLGEVSMEEGAYQHAVQSFQKALKREPQNPRLWEALGTAQMKMERFGSAQKCFARALEENGGRIYSLIQSGVCHVEMEEYALAKEMYLKAVALDGDSVVGVAGLGSVQLLLSKLRWEEGAYGAALREAAQALDLLQSFPRKHHHPKIFYKLLGDLEMQRSQSRELNFFHALQRSGSPAQRIAAAREVNAEKQSCVKRALSWYGKLLKWDPVCGGARGDYIVARMRLSELEGTACPDSELFMLGALSMEPESVELWVLLSQTTSRPQRKEYALNRALEIDPYCSKAWLLLCRLYRDHGRAGLADEALTQARIRDAASAEVWATMGEVAVDPAEARDAFLYALELGASVSACMGIVSLVQKRGLDFFGKQKCQVLNAVYRGVVACPLTPEVWNAYGLCLEDGGRPLHALGAFDMAAALLQAEGDEPEARQRGALDCVYTNAGRVAAKGQHWRLCLQNFERIEALDAASYLCHAYALHKSERNPEAQQHLEAALEHKTDAELQWQCYKLKVTLALEDGAFDEALEVICQMASVRSCLSHQNDLFSIWVLFSSKSLESGREELLVSAQHAVGSVSGRYATCRAMLHFCDHLRSAAKDERQRSHSALRKAIRLQPWNMQYHWTLLESRLQESGKLPDSCACSPTWNATCIAEMAALHGHRAGDVAASQLWVAVLSLLELPMDMTPSIEQLRDIEKRVKGHVHLCPFSPVAWFLLWLVSYIWKQTADPGQRMENGDSGKIGQTVYQQMREPPQVRGDGGTDGVTSGLSRCMDAIARALSEV